MDFGGRTDGWLRTAHARSTQIGIGIQAEMEHSGISVCIQNSSTDTGNLPL